MGYREKILESVKEGYHIAGNIGKELNLVGWQFWKQTTKLKLAL